MTTIPADIHEQRRGCPCLGSELVPRSIAQHHRPQCASPDIHAARGKRHRGGPLLADNGFAASQSAREIPSPVALAILQILHSPPTVAHLIGNGEDGRVEALGVDE